MSSAGLPASTVISPPAWPSGTWERDHAAGRYRGRHIHHPGSPSGLPGRVLVIDAAVAIPAPSHAPACTPAAESAGAAGWPRPPPSAGAASLLGDVPAGDLGVGLAVPGGQLGP